MALPRFGMPRFVITLAGTEGAKFRRVSRIEVAQRLTSQARLNATLLIPGSFGEQCGKIWTPGSGWARRCQNLCVVDPSPPAGTEGAKFQKVSCFEDVHVLTLLTPQCVPEDTHFAWLRNTNGPIVIPDFVPTGPRVPTPWHCHGSEWLSLWFRALAGTEGAKFCRSSCFGFVHLLTYLARPGQMVLISFGLEEQRSPIWTPGSGRARGRQNLDVDRGSEWSAL